MADLNSNISAITLNVYVVNSPDKMQRLSDQKTIMIYTPLKYKDIKTLKYNDGKRYTMQTLTKKTFIQF